MAFCEFVLLAACFAFVAAVSGLMGPSGGNCFQFLMLFSAIEIVGHIALFSGFVNEGHFKLTGSLVSGTESVGDILGAVCSGKRPAGQFCKGTLKDEESTERHGFFGFFER